MWGCKRVPRLARPAVLKPAPNAHAGRARSGARRWPSYGRPVGLTLRTASTNQGLASLALDLRPLEVDMLSQFTSSSRWRLLRRRSTEASHRAWRGGGDRRELASRRLAAG